MIYEFGGPEEFFLRKRGPSIPVPIPVPLLRALLAPFAAFDRVRTLMERISILSRDKLASNDSLMRDFAVEFTRLADGLVKTVRPAPDQALRPRPS